MAAEVVVYFIHSYSTIIPNGAVNNIMIPPLQQSSNLFLFLFVNKINVHNKMQLTM